MGKGEAGCRDDTPSLPKCLEAPFIMGLTWIRPPGSILEGGRGVFVSICVAEGMSSRYSSIGVGTSLWKQG